MLDARQFAGTVGFGADSGTGKLRDPLVLTLHDLTLDTTVQQTLFTAEFAGDVGAAWRWGPGGISLGAPLDGVSGVSLSVGFDSPWITDPSLVDSTVSLRNGVFSATGLFAGLAWDVTATRASLASSLFDALEIPYEIPAALLDAGHLYSLSLDSELELAVAVEAPEPATLASALLGLLMLAGMGGARRLRGVVTG